ncbi:BMP family ABC transporter substrate-binding protein [Streptomyces parvulus]|uniref:BMP family ABC transporter substrate-binding protein n=1 Tax=Streptomyces parvulus TaxID=146923 RepID=A0A191V2M4_9ACTN|nr:MULTISPECIES: BMP family ABC transporter substrate-binding protein [Streptomyces]ANJ09163.1 BMP family ABC transporter substrate-binding protein [Streptomyces parvulus]MCC9156929.1 BMP family ABC transporter substrate-binding protein [Streptomyces parvulus]MCE7690546.1 BMP family ABC transporter substrate-binding protein [Streptomyces parvulus]MCQ4193012.1 BMP family ABC transporter substrate-binding protein [Streptomyces parvulus]MZD58507.1 BMP family ABC transporter substrate-binding prot
MRRISRITVAGAATASLALALSACGGTSTSSGSDSDGDKGLAIAYDVGGKGDQSFNDAAYAGLEQAKKEFGYETADVEPTDGETDADKEQRLVSLAKQGHNPVVGVGYAYAAAIKSAAEKYPDTTFGIVDDATIESKNVADLVFNEEQASYLAGVAAAKSTKTDTVGFVGGVDIPLIHKFQAGFAQGVKDTDPKVKVLSQYLTQTAEEGGFSSPDKGKTAAEGQIEKKADVVYAAAGLSGQGVIEAAAAKKIWAIGVDSDQYKQEALAKYKDYILTSATKDVAKAVYNLAKSVEDGKPETGIVRGDLKSGEVGLSDSNPKFADDAELQAAIKTAKEKIISGEIKVKSS